MFSFKKKPADPEAVKKALEKTSLELVIYPAFVLKRKCEPVYLGLCPKLEENFKAAAELGKKMVAWVEAYNSVPDRRLGGVGLAAPQVGHSVQLFVVMPHGKKEGSSICINPKILGTGREEVEEKESCLSVPEKKGMKKRHAIITVQYWDENGELIVKTLRRWEARIFQHEMDHLQGKLCIERPWK